VEEAGVTLGGAVSQVTLLVQRPFATDRKASDLDATQVYTEVPIKAR